MKKSRTVSRVAAIVLLCAGASSSPCAQAAEKSSFNVAWSIYVGWMPWDYADRSGILKKLG